MKIQHSKYIHYLKHYTCLLLFLGTAIGVNAQSMPDTEIYVTSLKIKKTKITFTKLFNITDRTGYDNQPTFTPNGKEILFTSIREKPTTDIFAYHLKKKTTRQFTNTPEGEYSPTISPDKKYVTVVRGEEQQLWKFPLGQGEPQFLFSNPRKVGYFAWLNADSLAVFMLGDAFTLNIATTAGQLSEPLAQNIGRALHKIPGTNAFSFVHKIAENNWQINQFDLKTRQIAPIIKTLPNAEDLLWITDGTILMGQGSKLYKYKPGVDTEWQEIADFADAGIKNITRLAINPKNNRLAFVGVIDAKP